MWKKRVVVLVLLAAATGLPALAEHHEGEAKAKKPPLTFFIWTDHVETHAREAYREAAKAAVDKLRGLPESKKLEALVLSTPDGYMWAMPMAGVADFPRLTGAWDAAIEAAGGPSLWDGTSSASSHGEAGIYVYREDLSYVAAEPREAEKNAPARWYDFWYAKPEMYRDLEEVAKKLSALYAEKKIDSSWRVYQAITGPEVPLYVVSFPMTNQADFHANNDRIGALLGEESQKLLAEARKCARRVEHSWAWIVEDLSLSTGGGEEGGD